MTAMEKTTNGEEIQFDKLKPWQIPLWGLANGINNLFMIVMMFVSYVAADGYGIAVVVAGMIATASRVFDAVTDPIIALVDELENRGVG